MAEWFLTGGRILNVTEEQSLNIAKCYMMLPEWKKITVNGTTFRLDEIDVEAYKASKIPKQESLGIRVKTVDVEKKSRKRQKSIDFSN